MKKSKLLLTLLLTLTMTVGLLAGCGSKEEAASTESTKAAGTESTEAADKESAKVEDAESEDLYVIDMLVDANTTITSSLDTKLGQWIADEFGIAFNYVPFSGDMSEQQALLLAGGDYNEIQQMSFQDMVQQYIGAGALLNLDDYKDLLPDFYTMYEDVIPYWRSASEDGGLYKWETKVPDDVNQSHFDVLVRADVLEYYGYPELVTASDWIAFLEQAMKDFPTSYDGQPTVGLTASFAESYGIQGLAPIGFEKGYSYMQASNDYYIYNVEDTKFEEYVLDVPETKESLQFFNDLYTKGLLDEECFTDTNDITQQKMNNGRAIAVWYTTWNAGAANAALEEAGHPEMCYVEMPFQLDSQEGQKRSMPAVYSVPSGSYGITDKCKDPEKLMTFINWCCTEEGQILLQSGFEGEHYTVNDEGIRVPTDFRIQCTQDRDLAKSEGLADGSVLFPGLPAVFSYASDGQPYCTTATQEYKDTYSLNDTQRKLFEAMGWESSKAWWEENGVVLDPGFWNTCAPDVNSELGKRGAKAVEVRIKYTANLIMADDFESVWNEMIGEYEEYNTHEIIDVMNETLSEKLAALNK